MATGTRRNTNLPSATISHAHSPLSSTNSAATAYKTLEDDFQTTTNGRAGDLLARTGTLSGHPSKQQPRSTLPDLFILR
ncbi:hypothetical protein J6590_053529 [Homalodisca vitripennis]|nr:hypothetical protein J6590_053529 [Homalodisca vitripennis]